MRKQVPPEKTKDVLDFATKKPDDRLASIRAGLSVRSRTSKLSVDVLTVNP